MTVRKDYQGITKDPTTLPFPNTRLENTTPTGTQPFAVLGLLVGTQLTGTIITTAGSPVTSIQGDVLSGQVYNHLVRNVITYAANVEATWAALNIGDPVYYDRDVDATMPADTFLSTSPLASDATANILFGHITAVGIEDFTTFPVGDATASTNAVGVVQIGAGG